MVIEMVKLTRLEVAARVFAKRLLADGYNMSITKRLNEEMSDGKKRNYLVLSIRYKPEEVPDGDVGILDDEQVAVR